jgi:hypothetical protein
VEIRNGFSFDKRSRSDQIISRGKYSQLDGSSQFAEHVGHA